MTAQAVPTSDLVTIDAVLDRAAVLNAAVEAYVEPGLDGSERRSLTFSEWRMAADAAAWWLASHGVRENDVVCLLLGPSIDFAISYQAIVRLGAIATGINPRMGAREQASIFERMLPRVTIAEDDLAAHLPSTSGEVLTREMLGELEPAERPEVPPRRESDPVAVVWTSGTTGLPKGALFDHRSLRAVAAGTDVLSQPGDRRLSPLPFSHVSYLTRAWDEIAHGVTTVISPTPWSARTTLEVMQREAITVAQGVPTQWALLLELDGLHADNLPHLRVAGTGAARMAPAQVEEIRRRLGVPMVVRYTSTETSLGTGTRPGDPDEIIATTVGRPVSGVEIELVDDQGNTIESGEIGRVRLRSDAVMVGYVAPRTSTDASLEVDPTSTKRVRSSDGWITTGDFGRFDAEGNLILVGRDNEMYQRGGYNVYPSEIEQALDSCALVEQVAVVAAADPVLGEVGVAFVVASPGQTPTLSEVRAHVGELLADYKRPDALELIDALPLTPMGKVDKLALKDRADESARNRSDAIRATKQSQVQHDS